MNDLSIAREESIRDKGMIKLKLECYALYRLGLFGNRALAWDSYEELLASDWRGGVCIRSRSGMERAKVLYNIPFEEVRKEIEKLAAQGIPESCMSFNQSMPDSHLILQGEVMRGVRNGLELTYTHVQKPMNLGFKESTLYADGLKAQFLLKQNLWHASYSDLEALLERFPDCAVEFSAYALPVGDIPGRNTVIWEVRDY